MKLEGRKEKIEYKDRGSAAVSELIQTLCDLNDH
jgi:hypothetical protein